MSNLAADAKALRDAFDLPTPPIPVSRIKRFLKRREVQTSMVDEIKEELAKPAIEEDRDEWRGSFPGETEITIRGDKRVTHQIITLLNGATIHYEYKINLKDNINGN